MAPRKHGPKTTPATPQQKQQALGGGLPAPPSRRWLTGVVVDYDPNNQRYRVAVDGIGLNDTMPRLVRDPGETTILPPETVVACHDELGYWVIDAVIKQAAVVPSRLPPPTVTEVRGVGGEDPVRAARADGPALRAPTDPVDVLANDWVRRSPEGNLIGVLAGGVNTMQSSPFAAVRTHALEELVEIFAHKYRHLSSMGNFEIRSERGKTSLVWRAGSDQSNENGPGRENWTIRLDIGATGDLFDFSITTPEGQVLSRIHMNAQGRIQILGTDGVDIVSGGDAKSTTKQIAVANQEMQFKGDVTELIDKNVRLEIGGSRDVAVSGNDELIVGSDHNQTISRDWNHTVNNKVKQKVLGGLPTSALPGVAAYELEVVNGGITYIIGDALSGASPAGMQSFNVLVNGTGGVTFALGPQAAGMFNVITTLPASVNLGASGASVKLPNGSVQTVAVAPFGAMKFEPYAALMTALLTWLDTHVHICAVGPSTPPVIPSSPIIGPLVPVIRSVRVAIGL